jgi:DNA-nicking Smr family endonuclease
MNKTTSDNDHDDFSLFRRDVSDIQLLTHDRVVHETPPVEVKVRKRSSKHQSDESNPYSEMISHEHVGAEEMLSFRRSGIQERVLNKLRTGQVHLEAELDLHGMTITDANDALTAFLSDCKELKIRHVRIIHGKGWGSKDNKPILKAKLNIWLQHTEEVLAFCSAPIEGGGAGAVYVLLRKPKQ